MIPGCRVLECKGFEAPDDPLVGRSDQWISSGRSQPRWSFYHCDFSGKRQLLAGEKDEKKCLAMKVALVLWTGVLLVQFIICYFFDDLGCVWKFIDSSKSPKQMCHFHWVSAAAPAEIVGRTGGGLSTCWLTRPQETWRNSMGRLESRNLSENDSSLIYGNLGAVGGMVISLIVCILHVRISEICIYIYVYILVCRAKFIWDSNTGYAFALLWESTEDGRGWRWQQCISQPCQIGCGWG